MQFHKYHCDNSNNFFIDSTYKKKTKKQANHQLSHFSI